MMNNLVRYDARRGLMRWKMLLIPFFFILPLEECRNLARYWILNEREIMVTILDYWLSVFKGVSPPERRTLYESLMIPFGWLAAVGGSLWIGIDSFVDSLSIDGYSVLLKSGSRSKWILSKYIWSFFFCLIYFGASFLMASIYAMCHRNGGALADMFQCSEVSNLLLGTNMEATLSGGEIGLLFLNPLMTVIALNMIQMTLCLWIKPVSSFLLTFGYLVVSVYWPVSCLCGNGAMIIRSTLMESGSISPGEMIVVNFILIVVSITVGVIRFYSFDLIRGRE